MKLLRIELHKIITYRAFWVLLGIYLVFLILALLAMQGIVNQILREGLSKLPFNAQISIYEFPDIWHYLTYLASWFKVILAVLVIFLVCNEFTYKTLRQQVINGLSRWEFFLGKLYLILAFALLSTLIVLAIGLPLGFFSSKNLWTGEPLMKIDFLLGYFVQCLPYLLFAFLIAFLVKRAALAIGIFFVYTFIADPLGRYFFKDHIGPWLPMGPGETLIENPLFQFLGKGLQEHPSVLQMGISLGYAGVFGALILLLLRKRDL